MESSSIDIALPERGAHDISAEAFEIIRRVLKNLRGFNLDIYKDKCIKRRIAIRIRASHCASAEEYCELLLRDDRELDLLLRVLTIHVSQFFRNPSTFTKLREEILPCLFARRLEDGQTMRLWSVGCASGEEPYTLAMILRESFADELDRVRVDIMATDVDDSILEVARQGVYGEERLIEVPEAMRRRWFRMEGGKYCLQQEIVEMVRYWKADLSDTEKFRESDLILCRNVLIYFERPQQEKIINGFADVLGSGGILVLGKSETLVGETRRRFQTICPVERIYRVI